MGVGVFFFHDFGEGVEGGRENFVGTVTMAAEDVSCSFFFMSTARTDRIRLEVPCLEGGANAAVGAGVFDDPSPSVEWKFVEQCLSGIVVNQGSSFLADEFVTDPPHLGEWSLNNRVQIIRGGTRNLLLAFPQLPSFAQEGSVDGVR